MKYVSTVGALFLVGVWCEISVVLKYLEAPVWATALLLVGWSGQTAVLMREALDDWFSWVKNGD